MAQQRAPHRLGLHLEAAADDRLIGPALDPQEAVVVHPREIGRADPAVGIHLGRPHLEQADFAVGHRFARRVVDDPQRATRVGTPDAPALLAPVLLVVGEVPPGNATAELRCRVRREHRHAVLLRERVGQVGVQRRGARDHRTHAAQIGGIEVGVEHHAERGGHEADGARLVPADAVDPAVDLEAFEQREAAAVGHGLYDPEQATEMDHRRVHDDDTVTKSRVGARVRLVVLRPFHHAQQRRVREVDARRWTGGPARQHAHGDAGQA